jgi:hypothetical protein
VDHDIGATVGQRVVVESIWRWSVAPTMRVLRPPLLVGLAVAVADHDGAVAGKHIAVEVQRDGGVVGRGNGQQQARSWRFQGYPWGSTNDNNETQLFLIRKFHQRQFVRRYNELAAPGGGRSEVGTYTAPYSMVSGAWSENFSSL